METKVALLELSIKLEIFHLFEANIRFLHKNMWLEVIKVIKPFFLKVFWCEASSQHDGYHVGSILKALRIVENLDGHKNVIWLASKYDVKVVVPLFMVCFDQLNPIVSTSTIASVDVAWPKLEENMFRVWASIEEPSWALVIGELSLFRRLFISSSTCAYPLAWWQMHEGQFQNVGFLAKQIFGILGFIDRNWMGF
jgi:hypothetical protein